MQERRFEGQVFHLSVNNGVCSIRHETVTENTIRRGEICEALKLSMASNNPARNVIINSLPPGSVFTFAGVERTKKNPWFTGDMELYHKLTTYIQRQGGSLVTNGGYVPFSNGIELGHQDNEAQARELSFITSAEEFLKTFGLTIRQAKKLDVE